MIQDKSEFITTEVSIYQESKVLRESP